MVAAVVVMLGLPQIAFAHPGHLPQDVLGGFLHSLTGIDHILAMIAVGLFAAQLGGRARWMLPSAFIGTMILGGLFLPLGASMAAMEGMIAASVIVLGLLVALRVRVSPLLGSAIVGLFALAHGYAHIHEIGRYALAQYVIGFSLATALLHGIGIIFGTLTKRDVLLRWSGAVTVAVGVLLFVW